MNWKVLVSLVNSFFLKLCILQRKVFKDIFKTTLGSLTNKYLKRALPIGAHGLRLLDGVGVFPVITGIISFVCCFGLFWFKETIWIGTCQSGISIYMLSLFCHGWLVVLITL